jgi:ketosteroid isomerase-like protein
MKNNCFITVPLIALLSWWSMYSQAQQPTNANLEEVKKAIAASHRMYFQAFAKGDSSLLINCYTKDCWIMPPNAPALCGIDAPLEFFKTAYYTWGFRNGKFITVDLYGNGVDFVTETGFWQLWDANNKPLDNGKFLLLWKKTDEGWKIFRDSFSSDQEKRD